MTATIKVKNGYWRVNGKKLSRLPHSQQILFDSHLRAQNLDLDVVPQSSFKNRSEAIKSTYNHVFKFKRDIDSGILALYERVNNLEFERKPVTDE